MTSSKGVSSLIGVITTLIGNIVELCVPSLACNVPSSAVGSDPACSD